MTPRRPPRALRCAHDDCGLPAIVVDRFGLDSTNGPVEHVRVECFVGHRQLYAAASLCTEAVFGDE